MVRPRGVLTIGVDAAPLFGEEDEFPEDREPFWGRLRRVKLLTTSLSHQITVRTAFNAPHNLHLFPSSYSIL
jgi:hypothetical protein